MTLLKKYLIISAVLYPLHHQNENSVATWHLCAAREQYVAKIHQNEFIRAAFFSQLSHSWKINILRENCTGWLGGRVIKIRKRVNMVTFEDYLMHNSYKEMTLPHKRDCMRLWIIKRCLLNHHYQPHQPWKLLKLFRCNLRSGISDEASKCRLKFYLLSLLFFLLSRIIKNIFLRLEKNFFLKPYLKHINFIRWKND